MAINARNWLRDGRWYYWLLALVLIALAVRWLGGAGIETNVLALLPAAERDPLVAQAVARFDSTLARKHVALVGAPDAATARDAAAVFAESLCASEAFADVQLRIDGDRQAAAAAVYGPHRLRLLRADLRHSLQQSGGAAAVANAEHYLYHPVAPISSAMLAADPLLLFYDFASGLGASAGRVQLQDGLLMAEHGGRYYVLLQLTLPGDPFAIAVQERVLPALDAATAAVKQRYPDAEVLDLGAARYANAGVEDARSEVATIGTGSLVGLVLLLGLVFRSPSPLLSMLAVNAIGCVAAFTVCWWVFGEVHLLTLVFGASLLGVAVDYSLHFFADRLGEGPGWGPRVGLARIFPAITVSLITAVTGYAGLYLSGFPGLQQMALFSAVGLLFSYLTVVALLPRWVRKPSRYRGEFWLAGAAHWLRLWRLPRSWKIVGGAVLLVFIVTGLSRLGANDDIRVLQSRPAQLVTVEQRIREITGQQAGVQFLLVRGETPEAVLEAEEALTTQLRPLVAAGALQGFDALTNQLPSQRTQGENLALIDTALADRATVAGYAEGIGLEPGVIDGYTAAVAQAKNQPGLDLNTWLDSPAGRPLAHLWLGDDDELPGFASMVALQAVRDGAALRELAAQNSAWTYIDKVADISTLFQRYRERAASLLGAAYCVILLVFCVRYGPRRALAVMLPPALAAMTTLAALGWLGEDINLFHLLALLLVLGIGVDYTLFLQEGSAHGVATMLAVLLSALTTELSFGLLALSATPALHGFGLTVFMGIAGSAVFAPLVIGSGTTQDND